MDFLFGGKRESQSKPSVLTQMPPMSLLDRCLNVSMDAIIVKEQKDATPKLYAMYVAEVEESKRLKVPAHATIVTPLECVVTGWYVMLVFN